MTERDALFSTRLKWIDTWAGGWRKYLNSQRPVPYELLALDVAVAMIEELLANVRDPQVALLVLAGTHESGMEIGEAVDSLRATDVGADRGL